MKYVYVISLSVFPVHPRHPRHKQTTVSLQLTIHSNGCLGQRHWEQMLFGWSAV